MQRKVMMMAVACAMNGKDKPLFDLEEKEMVQEISVEERQETLNLLNEVFGGGS